jgi:hypothetical protein
MTISTEEERAISERIVRDFGNGILKEGYLFDQIEGRLGRRVRLSDALHEITAKDVIVLLDRHPNNRTFAQQVMNYLGKSDTWGFVVHRTTPGDPGIHRLRPLRHYSARVPLARWMP